MRLRPLRYSLLRASTACVTLVTYVAGLVLPSIAYAAPSEEISDYERVDGSSLSTAGDRVGATAVESQATSDGDRTGDDLDGDLDGQDSAGDADSGASTDGAGDEGADGETPNPADPITLNLPSGDDKSGVTGQAISIPKGAGSIQGMEESFSAQLSTGVATFSVPFALPKARGGAQPSLGLSYSSGGGAAGPAGQGWSVGVPFIARQTDRGLPTYDDRAAWHAGQDTFVFNGGQELVPICTVVDNACSGAIQERDADAEAGVTARAAEKMPGWASGWQYFRPRVEGSFLRFFWSPDHRTWIVQDKSGTTMELGAPAPSNGPAPGGAQASGTDALDRNPTKTDEVYRWHLSRQYDQHIASGVPLNLVVYDYAQHGGMAYLTDIYDTSPVATASTTNLGDFGHHTRLRWEARPDPTESYRSGWLITAARRLAGVDVTSRAFNEDTSRHQVRRYHLSYSVDSHRTLLEQVQVEGRCAGGTAAAAVGETGAPAEGAAGGTDAGGLAGGPLLPSSTGCGRLPPMRFSYSTVAGYQPGGAADPNHLPGYLPFDGRVRTLASSPDHSLDEELTDFFDINSDGLPDVLVTAPGLYNDGHAVFFGGHAGALGFSGPTLMGIQGVLGANASTIKLSNSNVAPLDLDGDGRINLVHMPQVKTYSIYDPRNVNGTWKWVGRKIETASGQNQKIDFGQDTRDTQVMDVDFDGLVDVVVSTGTEYQTFFSLGRYPNGDGQFGVGKRTGPNSAQISNNPKAQCVPHSSLPVRFGDGDVRLGDMNGDGITDIVRVRRGDIQYWPGRGNGMWGTGERDNCPAGTFGADRYSEMASAPYYSDIDGATLKLSDVNGDGLDDLVQIRYDAVDIWLNVDGKGWTERHILDGTPYHAGYHNRVRLIDVNGSGTLDLLWGDAESYKYIDLEGGKKPYLLVGVDNGLGKTTELEYSTSTDEMRAAEGLGACPASGILESSADPWTRGWCKKMPTVAHVVKRVTERDNITIRGRPAAAYVTEYDYRDPVFEGRQREFRGFSRARARRVGDANSPLDVSESVFLLGECLDPADGSAWDGTDPDHYCAPQNRWKDHPYEALKGLPVETHQYDGAGVHLSSTENLYTIRTLYTGLDGRAVRHAFLSQTDSLLYDTARGAAARMNIARDGYVDEDRGSTAGPEAPSGYAAGAAHVRSRSTVDEFGNRTAATNFGCVGGAACAAIPGGDDEAITETTVPTLLDHSSGWLWRTDETYVTGSANTARRKHTTTTYDALGRPTSVGAHLSGTVTDIRRELGAGVAPGGAVDTAGTPFVQGSTAYDAFGNAVRTRAVNGRCAEVSYADSLYGLFPTSESIFTEDSGSVADAGAACSGHHLTSLAIYDQGFGVVTDAFDLNDRPTHARYDQFGRLVALFKPSATSSGLSAAPSVIVEYRLPGCSGCAMPSLASTARHSVIHSRTQDGTDEDDAEYLESYAYVDGMGRTLVTLAEADPEEDGAGFVAGSLLEWDQKGAVSKKFLPFFWDGDPLAFNYASAVSTAYGRQRYDAFGRQIQTYDLDGTITLQSQYHALGTDLWDAADVYPGPHQNSYASEQKDGHGRTVRTTERFRDHGVMEQRHVETTYLPTGEPTAIRRVRGSEQVVRWMRYDSLGRMVLNVDANTSEGFTPDPTANAATIETWRYSYNFFGDLIATSDARGCGQNFSYDGAGRILGEDYAPCEAHHAAYSAPSGARDAENHEVTYYYDDASSVPASAKPSGWDGGSFTQGRAIAVLDRASASFTTFDGRGRTLQSLTRVARPTALTTGGQATTRTLSTRYAPRVYHRSFAYDAADRQIAATTGTQELRAGTDGTGAPLVPELLSSEATPASTVTTAYTKRGTVKGAGSSYGPLIADIDRTADGLVTGVTYGDIAATRTAYLYDERRRISSVQTYRGPPASGGWGDDHPTADGAGDEPTRQLVLQDEDFLYDVVGNPVEIRDWRDAADWPAGAKPVTKKITYDDLNRAVDVRYEYADGDDEWKSPFENEIEGDANEQDPRRAKPSPHVGFDRRILRQTFEYDWLGNNEKTTDDAGGFYDRSLGNIDNSASGKPYQMRGAALAAGPGATSSGHLEARYDAAGYQTGLLVERSGECLAAGSSDPDACNQRFDYQWDEVGRLSRARRWDAVLGASLDTTPLPTETPAADLRYAYDASDQRVIKQAVDEAEEESFTLYVFDSLELRRAQFGEGFAEGGVPTVTDYEVSTWTVVPYLLANGVRLARVVYEPGSGLAGASSSDDRHVFFELGDHLGSTSVVLDQATSELVERSTYQAYGGAESTYRPTRWRAFREDYRFTGKEEDVEVGLQYFGKRYLNPLLGRWISADPLAVHAPGEADANLYAYVRGYVLKAIDPLGLENEDAGAGGASSTSTDPGSGHEGAPSSGAVAQEESDPKAAAAIQTVGSMAGVALACLGTGGLACGAIVAMEASANMTADTPAAEGSAEAAAREQQAGNQQLLFGLALGITMTVATLAADRTGPPPPPDEKTLDLIRADLEARGEIDIDQAFENASSGPLVQFDDSRGALDVKQRNDPGMDIWFQENIIIRGAGPDGRDVELRTHSPNPSAPDGSRSRSSYTTQIETRKQQFVPDDGEAGGSWVSKSQLTEEQRSASHMDAGN